MAQRIQKPDRFGYEPDPLLAKEQIKDLVIALNGPMITKKIAGRSKTPKRVRLELDQSTVELRSLVKAWNASGPNLKKFFKKNPALQKQTQRGHTIFAPHTSGRGYLEWEALPFQVQQDSPKHFALNQFMMLICNPLWKLLGGPCKQCGDYYAKKTNRGRIYCNKSCSSIATAIPAIHKQREDDSQRKLLLAQEHIDALRTETSKKNWKQSVAASTGISRHWLTRAVNDGRLHPPSS